MTSGQHLLEALAHEVMEGEGPLVSVCQPGGRLPADHEDDAHGVHCPSWWGLLAHLDRRDAKRPDVYLITRQLSLCHVSHIPSCTFQMLSPSSVKQIPGQR